MSSQDDQSQEDIRVALDEAQSGAPAGGKAVRDRFSAGEVFQRIVASAEEEMESGHQELFFSGIAAGFAITLTVMAYAAVSAAVGNTAALTKPLLYPLGFIFIILGHYQLYTEETLPPVTLVLTRLASIPALLRVWGLVIIGNLIGVGIGAFMLANTGVLSADAAVVAEEFGLETLRMPWWDVFFKGVFAGWLVGGLVWLDHAVRTATARLILIYLIMYTIPVAGLFHIITSMTDGLYLVFRGEAALWPVTSEIILPVLLGNTLGGVVPVAILNYAQTEEHRFPGDMDAEDDLSLGEWFLGGLVGRTRVEFEDER